MKTMKMMRTMMLAAARREWQRGDAGGGFGIEEARTMMMTTMRPTGFRGDARAAGEFGLEAAVEQTTMKTTTTTTTMMMMMMMMSATSSRRGVRPSEARTRGRVRMGGAPADRQQ